MERMPYYICTDLNLDPELSAALQTAIIDEWVYDVVKDAYNGLPPPTYSKNNVAEDTQGPGVTRIDTILTNEAAANACTNICYQYGIAKTFDHVPIQLTINAEKFSDEITVAVQPVQLDVRSLQGHTCTQRAALREDEAASYRWIWSQYEDQFGDAEANDDLEQMDGIWTNVAETFLWQQNNPGEQLPPSKPRRGSTLPQKQQPIAAKLCDVTRSTRNDFTNRIDSILGLMGDTKNRTWRIFRNKQAQDDTLNKAAYYDTNVELEFDCAKAKINSAENHIGTYDANTLFTTACRLNNQLANVEDLVCEALSKCTDETQDTPSGTTSTGVGSHPADVPINATDSGAGLERKAMHLVGVFGYGQLRQGGAK